MRSWPHSVHWRASLRRAGTSTEVNSKQSLAALSLYGAAAERLHEEIVPVTARWISFGRSNDTRLSLISCDGKRIAVRLVRRLRSV